MSTASMTFDPDGQRMETFQLMQGKPADIHSKMNTTRACVYAVTVAFDCGTVTRADAPVARLIRDAKLVKSGVGAGDIGLLLTARDTIGAMR